MRKMFKKIVAVVSATAFALSGTLCFGPTKASAADPTTFGNTICVAGEYQNWNNSDQTNVLTKNEAGTKYVGTITIPANKTSTDLQLCNFGTWDKAPAKIDGGDALEQNTIGLSGTAGTLSLSYDISSQELSITDNGDVLQAIVVAETFRVVGAADICGTTWDNRDSTNNLVDKGNGVYSKTYTRIPASDSKYEVKVLQDADNYGWNYTVSDSSLVLANGNMGITVSEISDVTFTVTVVEGVASLEVKVEKSALNAEDIDAMIAELPSVDDVALTDKAAVEAAKAAYDGLSEDEQANVTKKADLDALLAKIEEIEAEAADSANVILHFKNTDDWSVVKVYAFDADGFAFLGEWPGQTIPADEANDGWVAGKFEYASDFTVIFSGDGKQTVNIPITVNSDGKTEVWITMGALAEEADDFGNKNYTASVSTTAPANYDECDVAVLAVSSPEDASDDTTDDTTDDVTDDTTDDTTNEDVASAWDNATLKIHVQLPEGLDNWEKLGAYLFGTGENFGWSGGSGELSGSWPGTELILENGSENGWYAFGGTFTDGYYMLIINNFVSDAEAADGAVKCQTNDMTITDGEYWITIAADPENEGKYIATLSETAPEDYDGNGLSDDDVVADDTTDDTTDDTNTDDANTDDTTDDTNKDTTPGTGDMAPIAAVAVMAMISAAGVVTFKRRKTA